MYHFYLDRSIAQYLFSLSFSCILKSNMAELCLAMKKRTLKVIIIVAYVCPMHLFHYLSI